MLERNVTISIVCTIIVILILVNLYFNWKCNNDTSYTKDDNVKFAGMPLKKFKHTLNIFTIIVIIIAWFCCLILFTRKADLPAPTAIPPLNEYIGDNTYSNSNNNNNKY
jgi:hypothetical protein